LVGCIRGIAAVARRSTLPSNRQRLPNETNGKAILPTPSIGSWPIADYTGSATLAFKVAGKRTAHHRPRRARSIALPARRLQAEEAPAPVDLAARNAMAISSAP
jgi:phosphoribosylformylglycinamidine synthase